MSTPPPASLRPTEPPRHRLADLASFLGATVASAGEPVEVTGLSLSSQRVLPGDLYAALPGARAHGAAYADDARAAGAVAVLTDPAGAEVLAGTGPALPTLVVDEPRRVLGRLAAHLYGEPATAMRMIGVTGTQGKTTTTRLAEAGLSAAGVRAGVIGTVGTRIAGADVKTSLTTPEAPDLHALFALMREQGVEACAMEVSSHALVMGRVDGVVFDVAVFLNLGRDHLDFHADVEDYYRAKASLFTPERARLAIVNVDDDHGRRLAGETSLEVRTLSTRHRDADWSVAEVVPGPDGTSFTVHGPGVEVRAAVPVPGGFNVANALAAVAACAEAGLDPQAVADGIARGGGVPGRLERVEAGQPFTVVVDYAHKPDAVQAALESLRPLTSGRLITVLGAGGDRDPGKRPLMGEIAARLSDVLVVTDDNPRTEDPAAIRAAVRAGVPGDARADVHEVGERREAIATALALAGPGDIVVVAGKGHETGQEVDGVVHPFDDREVVRELLTGAASAP
ncbi:UDP-N-acetylmuramoyl-L-alanyl-D-glutamate--2,6-diaminopimelate ligase [Nocardioides sp. YIM 123512]|uniref:UDP-N-acetylmuramoyl-L-alanyl-D-glutamate--2,6-diaminopimelate ligase n=1 Tax=Nocardioides flavescens TaxID=2691959 RepID=A0A6L7F328_9ACTN|nr:UDP-N-acetylmuramoyl-L-alanyl-D-glutamate--2,6-diaminopimelate ligase [Nocardioides flavescens]